MKKAFEANVSRAKPRVRLGAMMAEGGAASVETIDATPAAMVEALAQRVAAEPVIPDLAQVMKHRQESRVERPAAAEVLRQAIEEEAPAPVEYARAAPAPHVERAPPQPHAPVEYTRPAPPPMATIEAPAEEVEVQAEPPPQVLEDRTEARRERLKERLKAVRENPRPDPLPETVAEAGVLAVERISALQTEVAKARALNLTLTQDLEATRRQAERATE